MLLYLVVHNKYVTANLMKFTSDMIYTLQKFHMEQYFIQQIQERKIWHSFSHWCAYTTVEMYFCENMNRKYLLLDNPDNNNISINSNYQEWFPTFMLALWLFIIGSMTIFYLIFIEIIEYQLCISTVLLYYRRYGKKILPTNILTSLVIHNYYVNDICKEAISSIKFQPWKIHIRK